MKKFIRITVIFCLASLSLFAIEKKFSLKVSSRNGYPYITDTGQVGLIYTNQGGRLCLNSSLSGMIQILSPEPGISIGKIQTLFVTNDNLSQPWVLWESRKTARTDILIGKLTNENIKLSELKNVSAVYSGNNFSPALIFSLDNTPWAAWTNKQRKRSTLQVKNLVTDQSWIIDESSKTPILSPILLADEKGQIWIFWVGQKVGLDEIFYSIFNGETWTDPNSLSADPEVPSFHPTAALDSLGNPWAAWSSYDGEDYEIYISGWDGRQWQPKQAITQNSNISDGEPCLVFFQKTIPVLAWSRVAGDKKEILMTWKEKELWREGVSISGDLLRNHRPILLPGERDLIISWERKGNLLLKSLSFETLYTLPKWKGKKIVKAYPPTHLSRNQVIAFGDSITYGWSNGDFKEKGYPPRLAALLPDIFESPKVYNRGVPAEATWEAIGRVTSVITTDLALYFQLMEGTNDVSVSSYSLDTTVFNLSEMLNKCLQYGLFPLISTIPPRAGHRWVQPQKDRTFELNKKIRTLARKENIFLIDNFKVIYEYPESLGGFRALITKYPDNLHPNETGYQVMAENWFNGLKTMPFPPVEITAKTGAGGTETIMNWETDPRILPDSNLSGYRLYRKKQSNKDFKHIASVDASVLTYRDIGLTAGNSYVYAFSAFNKDDIEGPLSEPVEPDLADPYPPVNTQAKILRRQKIILLTWEKNQKNKNHIIVQSYRIYRKNSNSPEYSLIKTVSANEFSYKDKDYATDQNYVYSISTFSTDEIEGPKSLPIIPVIGDPYPPIDLSANLFRKDNFVRLDWNQNPKNFPLMEVLHYRIYRKKVGDTVFSSLKIVTADTYSYDDSSILPDEEYIYTISGINSEDLEGPFSKTVTSVISDPYPPENILIETVVNKAFFYEEHINHITWSNSVLNRDLFTITKYRIYRKSVGESDQSYQLLSEVSASQLWYLDRHIESLDTAHSYVYGIAAVDWNNVEGPISTT